MPAGRPTDYKPEYCQEVMALGRAGKSKTQIAVALDTSKASLDRWSDAHEEFRTALTRAQECAQAWWEDQGQVGMVADKFNATVWSKSVSARFKEDYTEQREVKQTGEMTHNHKHAEQMTDDELARIAATSGQ